eukprot:Nk52_evm21s271 gene=Nk52_evmTU21s271
MTQLEVQEQAAVKEHQMAQPPFKSFGTTAIHAGQEPDATGAVVPHISMSTTFKQSSPGVHSGFEYSRSGNPMRNVLEANIAGLEDAKHSLCFSSGLGCTTTILHLLKQGDHLVSMSDVYGGTNRLFSKISINNGISSTFVDATDLDKLKGSLRPNTKLVWLESPTNPTLRLTDIRGAVAMIKEFSKDIIVVVDNTFMSSYFQRPLSLGADIVMHSLTKYMNGHSDVVMGACATNSDKLHDELRYMQNAIGGVPSPFDCFMVNRGLKTLHIRMREHEKNAKVVAQFLSESPKVHSVMYPGLKSHPQHELAKSQTTGFGGMVSFRIAGNVDNARKFLESLKVFTLAESLGAVESLAESPALMTHMGLSQENRDELGITDTLIRLSVGLEDISDLVEDLHSALRKAVPDGKEVELREHSMGNSAVETFGGSHQAVEAAASPQKKEPVRAAGLQSPVAGRKKNESNIFNENSALGERPSSKVIKPPGGGSSFTFG